MSGSEIYDAIVALGGGGQRDDDTSSLPLWVRRRLEKCLNVWRSHGGVENILVLSGGTTHVPNYVGKDGWPIFESTAQARYLQEHGVLPEMIFREYTSYDTIGNAYFARTEHTEPAEWRRLLIVTSEFHMPRSEAIFRWLFSLSPQPQRPYELTFVSVSDDDVCEPDVLSQRIEREQASLKTFNEKIAPRIRTMKEAHTFIYREHKAYATWSLEETRQALQKETLSEEVKKTY